MASSCEYKGCRVPAEDHSEFCIFHRPSPKDIKRFQEALTSQINEKGLEDDRNERYSFRGYIFPAGLTTHPSQMEGIHLPIRIEGDAFFVDATIEGDVAFDHATLKGNAWFALATIEGGVSFVGTMIEGHTSFIGAKIDKYAWFMHATVDGSFSLREARIGHGVGFDHATIRGQMTFQDAKIQGDVRFEGARIEGAIKLHGTEIGGDTWFTPPSECASLDLGLDKPHIHGWGNERCGISIKSPAAAQLFWRFAQRLFSKIGEREKADAAFYFERLNLWRKLRRIKADGEESWMKTFWTKWVIRPGYGVLFLLDVLFVRWTTAYGASVARLFFAWAAVIGGFGIAFSMLPRIIGRAGEQIWTLRNWIVGIHYSVTTFATLGLGHINPGGSRLGMVLTSVEAILGAVLIALAVLVIGRRFMRQS